MEDKLVTLAIRTYQRAQIIKTVLEQQGIETIIHNLNQEHPEMAVGVRVRIKESDLPRALKIVEEMEYDWEEKQKSVKAVQQILLPIDFSDFEMKIIDLGFQFAKKYEAEIVFIHVYFSPTYTISSNNDRSTYSISDNDFQRRITTSVNADVENMKNLIHSRIEVNDLPKVKCRFVVKEGVPEDEIIDYCKEYKPLLVVMGTHGRKVGNELIGSVTAEVMEGCVSPVLAVPVKVALKSPHEIRRLAFLTNFDQKDLISIDRTIEFFGSDSLEVFFIHASNKKEPWNEIMLSGIKTYFANHYPDLITNYALLGTAETAEIIEEYLTNQKIDLLAFNTRKRNIFARLFHPGLIYKMLIHSDTPLFVTHA